MNSWNSRKKYGVIYADPPWRFYNYSGKGEGRNAVAHYDCLTFEQICAFPAAKNAAKDCVLFGAYILNLTGGNPALASVGTNVTQRPMTGKPRFGDRIATKTGPRQPANLPVKLSM